MQTFKVTKYHLKLLKNMVVSWGHCEFGAPAIDCKRPYGDSDVYDSMTRILMIKPEKDGDGDIIWDEGLVSYLNNIHEEMGTVLQIVLATGKTKAGKYKADDYDTNWKLVK